jgi:endonuclease YncB( thermonuclease family)
VVPSRAGDSLVGEVVAVKSANQITLDHGAGTVEVHIAGIEVDTRGTMASEARAALSQMVLGKTVRLRFDGYLPNGEMSGRIWLGGIERPEEPVKDVGLELVKAGAVRSAAGYTEYKYGELEKAEAEARQNRRGLWR